MTMSDLPVEAPRPWPGTSDRPVRLSRPHRSPQTLAVPGSESESKVHKLQPLQPDRLAGATRPRSLVGRTWCGVARRVARRVAGHWLHCNGSEFIGVQLR